MDNQELVRLNWTILETLDCTDAESVVCSPQSQSLLAVGGSFSKWSQSLISHLCLFLDPPVRFGFKSTLFPSWHKSRVSEIPLFSVGYSLSNTSYNEGNRLDATDMPAAETNV